jgi:hypothetical protein
VTLPAASRTRRQALAEKAVTSPRSCTRTIP